MNTKRQDKQAYIGVYSAVWAEAVRAALDED